MKMVTTGLLFGFAGLMWAGLRWFERANLFFPDRQLVATPSQVGMAYEDVRMTTADSVTIHGWYIPATPQPHAPTLLFFHGNAGNISHRLDKLQRLHALGANVFIIDYRGYGESEGSPTEEGLYRDADAASQWLTGRGIKAIVLYGESLGCAVAVETARRHPVAGVILESPFTSTVAMARRIFPWLPAKWIVRHRFDNRSKIPTLKAPLVILHSPQDEIVPYAMGRELYDAASGPKTFIDLAGDHNEGYIDAGPVYAGAIRQFLKGVFHD